MKRITAIILTVLICFSVTACKNFKIQDSSETDTHSTNESSNFSSTNTDKVLIQSDVSNNIELTEKENSTTTESSNKTEKDYSYQDIERVTILGHQDIRILPTNSKAHLMLKIPQEWKIEKSTNGFSIIKNSKIIGTITENFELSGVIVHEAEYLSPYNITSNYIINKTAENCFNHIFNYTLDICGTPKTITLCASFAELDYDSFYELFYNVILSKVNNRSNIGTMLLTDNRKKVLILGNSFIATSQIGNILQKMCGNDFDVEAQSRGNARVSTYSQDTYLLDRIKSGEFSVVLIRGIYDHTDLESFQTIADACNSSDTQLAAFPAHNENPKYINLLKEKIPTVLILNWKEDIDQLILSGISKDEFCVDDFNQHSTPLAGYVGAHIIYRAIFGKVPTQKSFTEVSTQQINLLGDYVNTGLVDSSVNDEYDIYKF